MTHQSSKRTARGLSFIGATLPVAFSVACSTGDVNLGDGLITRDVVQSSRCAESSRIEGDVTVANQSELQELAGCEEIGGNLDIGVFAGADLSPLASLRAVGGLLRLGVGVDVYSEDPEQQAALENYLESLHGLEALESVGALSLTAVLVEDLSELESLHTIDGTFLTYHLPRLKTLAGLEAVTLRRVWLTDCQALETLDGLTLDAEIESFMVDSVHALANIDALAHVIGASEQVMLSGTGLTALPELALTYTTQLMVDNNAELLDASALGTLQSVVEIYLAANPVLTAFPALPNLVRLDFLTVLGNGIESLALDFPAVEPVSRAIESRAVALSAGQVEIGWNPNLLHVTGPANFPAVQYFSIHNNERLIDVDLGTLERVDLLVIHNNAVLSSVAPNALATVDSLEITNNPNLVPDAFDDVQTFERVVTGNAPEAAAP